MPLVEQIASSYPSANFSAVRADCEGLNALSREYHVTKFPTLIMFRGKKEIGRVDGSDRFIGRIDDLLKDNVTTRDFIIHDALTIQAKFETRYGKEFATISNSELISQDGTSCDAFFVSLEEFQADLQKRDDEGTEQLEWAWDQDYAASNIKVGGYGTFISYTSDELEQDMGDNDKLLASVKWQMHQTKTDIWESIDTAACIECERQYRMGLLFTQGRITVMVKGKAYEITANPQMVKISNNEISGMNASVSNGDSHGFRRTGRRIAVKGDEKFTDKAQKSRDRYEAGWKVQRQRRKIEYKKFTGDAQGIRGTHGFMEDSGEYTWSMKWCHEPGRQGEGRQSYSFKDPYHCEAKLYENT